MKKNPDPVAVASRSFSAHPILRRELLARYENVTFNDSGSSLSGDGLRRFLANHSKAIIALEVIEDSILSGLPELRVISKYGVGLDKIDMEAVRRRGIEFRWTGGVNRRSVAELALCFMLTLIRKIPESLRVVQEGRWFQVKGGQLSGKTVGIIGCGFVGKDLVSLLKPFGVTLLVYDVLELNEFCRQEGIEQVELNSLLERSDIVTLHVPLDSTTRNLIAERELALMKPTAFLLNTARGGIVDEEALKRFLKEKRIAGAACDVFAIEPPLDEELLGLPNFVSTPHIGGSSEEAILAMGRAAIEGLG